MTWELDTAHTLIEFSAKHLMVSTVKGRFNKFSATLELDEQHPEQSSVAVTIAADSIDSGDARRDGHLRSPDFLDVAKFPHLTFTSKQVEAIDAENFRIIGDLKARGVTMLLVEQFAAAALKVADYGYVLENGRISVHGPADKLRDDPAVKAAYLGGGH